MPCLSLADRIDALLPQTQCTKCGYDGCRPYAEAIATGDAPINRCPPGGDDGIAALAALLDTAALPLDLTRGAPGPLTVARIDEAHCIGCTLCIRACPVDAIVGANKRMHTVLADWCTGCDLCVAPCPVDCIDMAPASRAWSAADAQAARQRHQARQARLARDSADNARLMAASAEPAAAPRPAPAHSGDDARKRAAIESALARARARRSATPT
ncbi:electron transport complex subunit RsxB [Bordetella petrii]|uniref:Electron transport complex protein, type B subunit n=1 Tax=Bordetella petrii (strain ATCC BAA-461 / DSM 12804 / CCUG 43448 / CIP 107267 / Se-1111R) TaxID=340100 RepID=A9IIB6_BORPD|nr:electron transport complex subunit RsxB [Bordetella petrii]CAP42065.1 Electron transport complex protein, type B subunit [Bordetella petrii]